VVAAQLDDRDTIACKSELETGLGEEVIAKINGILRSYPEGRTPESIGPNTNAIRGALEILRNRGEAVKDGDVYRSAIYNK
jgi:hypothetical protein